MKIIDILNQDTPTFSLEFFPPKTEQGLKNLYQTLNDICTLNPGFVSVTYGAGGSTRKKTLEIVKRIKEDFQIETMAHLTCVGHSQSELQDLLNQLQSSGIENVIALRGDPPQEIERSVSSENSWAHAIQLTEFIHQNYSFCIAVAGYPEGHPETPDKKTDWGYLVEKIQAGADFVITQLFFNNEDFFQFRDQLRKDGITVPIIPGVMPITNISQIERFTKMCGAGLPETLKQSLYAIQEDSEAVIEKGIEQATLQCQQLLKEGVEGIHFYTLNQSKSTKKIIQNLRGVI